MIKLLILADDFTGALDTGVQFASKGISTRVVVDQSNEKLFCSEVQVLVMDTETRHIDNRKAYEIVYQIVQKAIEAGITYIYKKTDSALRGNIGSELTAMLDAAKEEYLPFLPAFPKMKRWVEEGVLYIDQLPVSESVFGQDPFEPVTRSKIAEIIALQSNVQTNLLGLEERVSKDDKGIIIYDCITEEHISAILNDLKINHKLRLLSGCAGCAALLPEILELQGEKTETIQLNKNLLVMCGSINPITKSQLEYANKCGFQRIFLTSEQKLNKKYWLTETGQKEIEQLYDQCMDNKCCMIDTNDEHKEGKTMKYAKEHHFSMNDLRLQISESIGIILKQLMKYKLDHTLLITGGDTLLGFMKEVNLKELLPIKEIFPGCVLTKMVYENQTYYIITKSGGFGTKSLIKDIVDYLNS